MNLLYLKDNFIIRRAYKVFNTHNGIEKLYFILADGTVIYVDGTNIKQNPEYKILPDLKSSILRYGGKCSSCGNFLIGKQSKDGLEWEFNCVECPNSIVFSDKRVDEFVYEALIQLDKEIELD